MVKSKQINIEKEKPPFREGLSVKCQMLYSDQIRSITQSCPTLRNPMNCSTPGLPVTVSGDVNWYSLYVKQYRISSKNLK